MALKMSKPAFLDIVSPFPVTPDDSDIGQGSSVFSPYRVSRHTGLNDSMTKRLVDVLDYWTDVVRASVLPQKLKERLSRCTAQFVDPGKRPLFICGTRVCPFCRRRALNAYKNAFKRHKPDCVMVYNSPPPTRRKFPVLFTLRNLELREDLDLHPVSLMFGHRCTVAGSMADRPNRIGHWAPLETEKDCYRLGYDTLMFDIKIFEERLEGIYLRLGRHMPFFSPRRRGLRVSNPGLCDPGLLGVLVTKGI